MCVIFVIEDARPTADEVAKAFKKNPDGCGVAWRDIEDGEPVVKWKKGLFKVEEMQEFCATLPVPFVAHFRIQSVGGVASALCHPFPIEEDVPLYLEGTTKGNVLFHNGHWSKWKEVLIDAALMGGYMIPPGRWSDSRALAWFTHFVGQGYCDLVDEKIVIFGPETCDIVPESRGWSWHRNAFLVSNTYWASDTTQNYQGAGYHYHTSTPVSMGGNGQSNHSPRGNEFIDGKVISSVSVSPTEPLTVTTPAIIQPTAQGSVALIPLAEALNLHREGKLSQNALKKIRKYWNKQWNKPELLSH